MAIQRVVVKFRKSKYGAPQSFTYVRQKRKKISKKDKLHVGKVYKFKEVRDDVGRFRGLRKA